MERKIYEVGITGFYAVDTEKQAVAQFLKQYDHLFVDIEEAEAHITHITELPSSFYSDEEWEAIRG